MNAEAPVLELELTPVFRCVLHSVNVAELRGLAAQKDIPAGFPGSIQTRWERVCLLKACQEDF